MGRIQRFNSKTVIHLTVDEILATRVAADKGVVTTMGSFIQKFAQMKATQKRVVLPSGAVCVHFERETAEYIVEFGESLDALYPNT